LRRASVLRARTRAQYKRKSPRDGVPWMWNLEEPPAAYLYFVRQAAAVHPSRCIAVTGR